MIAMNCYLTAKPGKAEQLDSLIRDRWIKAMSEYPGFMKASFNKPYPVKKLDELQALKPSHYCEVVFYWRTERERLLWAKTNDCLDAWNAVEAVCDNVKYTLSDVIQRWSM